MLTFKDFIYESTKVKLTDKEIINLIDFYNLKIGFEFIDYPHDLLYFNNKQIILDYLIDDDVRILYITKGIYIRIYDFNFTPNMKPEPDNFAIPLFESILKLPISEIYRYGA